MKFSVSVSGSFMTLLLGCCAFGEHSVLDTPLPRAPQGQMWKLIWHDEFEGSGLDTSKWEIPPEGPRHAGWWMRKAVSVNGQGHLVIQTLREGDKIIDGCVRTKGKFAQAYGFYIARVQLPKEQGHWPAFWLFEGVHTDATGWYNGPEIDIFEKFWPNDEIKHTLYWNPVDPRKLEECTKIVTIPGIREGWHTFALWWTPTEYIYYIDGRETWRINPGKISALPHYIKLSDETATWCKDISKAILPDAFRIDYVRVYRCE